MKGIDKRKLQRFKLIHRINLVKFSRILFSENNKALQISSQGFVIA